MEGSLVQGALEDYIGVVRVYVCENHTVGVEVSFIGTLTGCLGVTDKRTIWDVDFDVGVGYDRVGDFEINTICTIIVTRCEGEGDAGE